jgi:putative lipoic acid-binding regulatory protein
MITAVAYDGYIELRIIATHYSEFEQDIVHLQNIIDTHDREYVSHKRVWKINNPGKYIQLPFVKRALLDRRKQMSLFF